MSRTFHHSPFVVSLICTLLLTPLAAAQSVEEIDADVLDVEGADENPLPEEAIEQASASIVKQTNALRTKESLAPLKTDEDLTEAAQKFADYMARTKKYGHTADDRRPSERAEAAGYDYCIVLENIAYAGRTEGFQQEELADKFFTQWKESKSHRRNMLDPNVMETGVAIAYSEKAKVYLAVQMFGRPESAQIVFQVQNDAGVDVAYRIEPIHSRASDAEAKSEDDQREPFELSPRLIRTHMRCRPSRLVFVTGESVENVSVGSGIRYVVAEADEDDFVLRREKMTRELKPTE